jgi:hypothetical protein
VVPGQHHVTIGVELEFPVRIAYGDGADRDEYQYSIRGKITDAAVLKAHDNRLKVRDSSHPMLVVLLAVSWLNGSYDKQQAE